MRTFTLKDGIITPGIPVRRVLDKFWQVEGAAISLNRDCLPDIQDGRIVTASFSKPHYPPVEKPDNLDWGTWQQWLRETPSVGKSTQPVYTLRREKTPNDSAILVMVDDVAYPDDRDIPWPARHVSTHRDYTSQPYRDVTTTIVRMTPGMRLRVGDSRRFLVYRHGALAPEYYTWRQWELEHAESLTDSVAVRCFTLKQTHSYREGVRQQCQPGIEVTPDTPLGAAIQLGTSARPEWLPLFNGGFSAVLQSATVGKVAERILQEDLGHRDITTKLKSQPVPLYGFMPADESDETTACLVRIEGEYFHESQTLRGKPTFIRWQQDESYQEYVPSVEGAVAFILKEGEAVGYTTRPRDPRSYESLKLEFVLHVRNGELHATAYEAWCAADMTEHAEEYLTERQAATLENIPPSWVGYLVELNRKHISGELMAIDGDSVLLRSGWSTNGPPHITRYHALWVTRSCKPSRKMSAAIQRKAFLDARVSMAVFRTEWTTANLLATDRFRENMIRPVAVVELGVCEKTGEVVLTYGAPSVGKPWGKRPWNVETSWYETYREAEQMRQKFIEHINDSTNTSNREVLVYCLTFERDHPDRLVW